MIKVNPWRLFCYPRLSGNEKAGDNWGLERYRKLPFVR